MIDQKKDILAAFEWRYATKKFDSSRKIGKNELEILLESLRLSPSSMGLQPYKFFHLRDGDIREELKASSFSQSQITDASDLIVFAAKNKINRDEIQRDVEIGAKIRGKDPKSVKSRVDQLSRYVGKFNQDELFQWSSRQAYIAMGFLLTTAAELKIDACPMEGIEPRGYDRILGLEALNLGTIAVVALGFRSEGDSYQWEPKVRKPLEDLITTI